ncbi:carbohydrate ABC transporter membrane protein 1, CUT1 family [Amycolatopsis tolypomycina]|uniref:Carbohydrate ABC transporter membrane protein 1, CUT1 family n=1 Tax=Amycolatopsis tolypomycina TaxID=208445 RepID=A0A1H4SRB9_9PSEU|nr:sugar ABC transporter permease [Amycolatopsis tolypomycina]SEC46351.1 carbohydrate ABC transporter membrane protein 1, CUT1 family [Amycolatopsis tolypomycina]
MRSRDRAALAPYLFLSPALALFTVFAFVPLAYAVVLSFQDVPVFGDGQWNGVANYTRLAADPLFWESLRTTLVFTVGTVPTSMALGLLLATLLNRALPARAVLRTLYFLPMVVSGVVVALVMDWIFNGDAGVLNNLLQALGLARVPWLTSPSWAMVTLSAAIVWGRIGFCMVIYLAALQSVPPSLLEASTLDGANRWQQFRFVTFPQLRPTTFMLLVVNVIFSLQVFDVIYVLTGGGPGFATTVLLQAIFRAAFTQGEMGYASAIGVVLTVLLLVFTLLQWLASRRREEAL